MLCLLLVADSQTIKYLLAQSKRVCPVGTEVSSPKPFRLRKRGGARNTALMFYVPSEPEISKTKLILLGEVVQIYQLNPPICAS